MKILAIDTSSIACSVALLLDDHIDFTHTIAPMQQAQQILTILDDLLAKNKINFNQLDALAFGCGPGSFTGLRIAASVIQGLAFASQLPVIKISSLAALAQATYDDLGWKNLLVAVDARVQEIYWAKYAANSQGLVELIEDEIVCHPENITVPAENNWFGVGNGWEIYHDLLIKRLRVEPQAIDASRLPMANAMLKLAKLKFEKGEWVHAEEALPVYLRDNVIQK